MKISLYDELVIQSGFSLSSLDMETLTFLYQPIIGMDSYSLYLTMSNYGANNQNKLCVILHKDICDLLGISILNYEKSRMKLEAVGLLQTFMSEEKCYCILNSPLSPNRFLNNSTLGAILKTKVGEQMFPRITDRFKAECFEVSNLKEVTKSLNDCFKINDEDINIPNLKEKKTKKVTYNFDFGLFINKIKEYLNEKDNTRSFKTKVLKLAELYLFNENDMKRVFMNSFNKNRVFEITEMDNAASEIYRKKNKNKVMIELDEAVNINVTEEMKLDLNSLIKKYFKVTTPEYLNIISTIMSKTGLNMEVMEMMLLEVAEYTKGVFPNVKYFEKVAGSYVQRGIKSKKDLEDKSSKNDLINEFLDIMNGGSN